MLSLLRDILFIKIIVICNNGVKLEIENIHKRFLLNKKSFGNDNPKLIENLFKTLTKHFYIYFSFLYFDITSEEKIKKN